MRFILTCSVILLTLAFIGGAASAAPRLTLPESNFNFGYAPQNCQISHIFWLHSTGDDSLIITNVVPGCGCTKAPLERSRLGVGDSTRLEIIFSTRHYTSHVAKHPRIMTNEGPPQKSVEIRANVMVRPDSSYPVIVKPYKLDLSQFGEKTRDEIRFSIDNVSDAPLKPVLISAPSELMTVKLPKEIAAAGSESAEVKLTSEGVKQEFERSFTFELNDSAHSRFTVPVKRTMKNPEAMSSVDKKGDH